MSDESHILSNDAPESAPEAAPKEVPPAEAKSEAPSKRKYKYEEQEIELGDEDLQLVLNEYGSFAKAIKAATTGTLMEKREFLKMTGIDPVEFAETLIAELVREELAAQKPSKPEVTKEETKAEPKKEPAPEEMQAAADHIESEIASVLEELGYSDKNPAPDRMVALIAEEMLATLDREEGRIHAKDAWKRVDERNRKDMFNLSAKMKPEEFVACLPKEFLLALQKHFVGQHASSVIKPRQSGNMGESPSQEPRKRSFKEEFGDLNAL